VLTDIQNLLARTNVPLGAMLERHGDLYEQCYYCGIAARNFSGHVSGAAGSIGFLLNPNIVHLVLRNELDLL
jgi:hypothetical protein